MRGVYERPCGQCKNLSYNAFDKVLINVQLCTTNGVYNNDSLLLLLLNNHNSHSKSTWKNTNITTPETLDILSMISDYTV